jgi:hypothetical protein
MPSSQPNCVRSRSVHVSTTQITHFIELEASERVRIFWSTFTLTTSSDRVDTNLPRVICVFSSPRIAPPRGSICFRDLVWMKTRIYFRLPSKFGCMTGRPFYFKPGSDEPQILRWAQAYCPASMVMPPFDTGFCELCIAPPGNSRCFKGEKEGFKEMQLV